MYIGEKWCNFQVCNTYKNRLKGGGDGDKCFLFISLLIFRDNHQNLNSIVGKKLSDI